MLFRFQYNSPPGTGLLPNKSFHLIIKQPYDLSWGSYFLDLKKSGLRQSNNLTSWVQVSVFFYYTTVASNISTVNHFKYVSFYTKHTVPKHLLKSKFCYSNYIVKVLKILILTTSE